METLHVNGTLRVEQTDMGNAIAILGVDSRGTLNQIDVGNNISITTWFPNTPFHNVDLELNGGNSSLTVFRIIGASNSFEFTGIAGGSDGKHILFLNVTDNNFRVNNEDSNSLEENRILTLGSSFESTSGQGAIELVYDGVLERWIVLNVRN